VEISPPLDPSGVTLFLGLQVIFEILAVVAEKRQKSGRPQPPPQR